MATQTKTKRTTTKRSAVTPDPQSGRPYVLESSKLLVHIKREQTEAIRMRSQLEGEQADLRKEMETEIASRQSRIDDLDIIISRADAYQECSTKTEQMGNPLKPRANIVKMEAAS